MEGKSPIIRYQDASKGAVLFVAAFSGLLGLMALLSFFQRISHAGPDEYFLLVFGCALIAFTVLFLRFMFLPSLVLDDRSMMVRRFFGRKFFRFEDVDAINSYTLWIRKRNGLGQVIRSMPPLEAKRIEVRTRDRKTLVVTLPSFGQNEELLKEISERSGIRIGELPEQTK